DGGDDVGVVDVVVVAYVGGGSHDGDGYWWRCDDCRGWVMGVTRWSRCGDEDSGDDGRSGGSVVMVWRAVGDDGSGGQNLAGK
nr:hypothetical protein [Tanacetum cinerariifolium]GFC37598.1 hypothetical protein [Tanacetum cinerariifolium]